MLTGTQNDDRFLTAFGKESISAGNGQDRVTYDATAYVSGGSTQTIDGGAGTDTLTIRLTRAQFEKLKTELDDYAATLPKELNFYDQNIRATPDNPFQLKPDMLKALMAGTLTTGQNNQSSFFTFNSIGVSIKQFEALRFEIVNAAPVVLGAVKGVAAEDGAPSTLNALANASDLDPGTVLSVMGVPGALPAGVTYDALSKTFTLDPSNAAFQSLAVGETTTVKVSFMVSDGIASTPASVCWTVTGTNDGPTVSEAVQGGAVAEDGVPGAQGAFAFADLDLSDSHALLVSGPAGACGMLEATIDNVSTGDGAGTVGWTYALNNEKAQSLAEGEVVTETWTIQVSDGKGGTVDKTVTITITGTNDAPVVTTPPTDATLHEDTAVPLAQGLIAFTDLDLADGHAASFAPAANQTALGTFSLDPVDEAAGASGGFLRWNYVLDTTKAQSLRDGESVVEHYTVLIDDGHGGTVSQDVAITIKGSNDQPELTGTQVVLANGTEDTPYLIKAADLLAGFTDADAGDVLSVAALEASTGTIVDNDDGTFTLIPLVNHNGVVGLTYSVVDQFGAAVTATRSFTLAAVNDAPVIAGVTTSAATTTEDGPVITGSIAASDVEHGPLTYSVLGIVPEGLALDTATGAFTFNPAGLYEDLNNGQSKDASFQVLAFDGTDYSAPFTVPLTVTGVTDVVNHTPVVRADMIYVSTNTSNITLPFSVFLANDEDDDLDTLTIDGIPRVGPSLGSFSVDEENGTITFDVTGGTVPNTFFEYIVSDQAGGMATGTVNVRIFNTSGGALNESNISLPGAYGASWIDLRSGADTFTGSSGAVIAGSTQRDWIFGGNGNDTLFGGAGNDQLDGGSNVDQLNGGGGNDTLIGGNNNDRLNGGGGNDVFVFSRDGARDVVEDFSGGNDTLDLDVGFTALRFNAISLEGVASTRITATNSLWSASDEIILKGVVYTAANFDPCWIV